MMAVELATPRLLTECSRMRSQPQLRYDKNLMIPLKFLQNSGIPQDFESVGSGILQKLQLSFLEILKFLGTQFGVLHSWGVDIFWNSPMEFQLSLLTSSSPSFRLCTSLKCGENFSEG